MVFQDLALWPNLSVLDNVRLGLTGGQLSRAEVRQRADDVLALCCIKALAPRKPGQLSAGQQQRVALARALAARPAFLLLDEPFGGLDLIVKTRLLHEIAELASRQQLTIVLVTHDPLEATMLCRFAVVLSNTGTVEDSGPLPELLENPRSEMLKILKGHMQAILPPSG
jgi:ABC-type sulfate/molybdate transport systems ATPase subunit